MAALTVQEAPKNGAIASLTAQAADAGLSDTIENDGRTVVVVLNGDAGAHTVTPSVVQDTSNMVTETGTAISVAAGEEAWMGPFEPGVFGSTVTLTVDAATSMSYRVVRLPRTV